jgi:hypothetical protein
VHSSFGRFTVVNEREKASVMYCSVLLYRCVLDECIPRCTFVGRCWGSHVFCTSRTQKQYCNGRVSAAAHVVSLNSAVLLISCLSERNATGVPVRKICSLSSLTSSLKSTSQQLSLMFELLVSRTVEFNSNLLTTGGKQGEA